MEVKLLENLRYLNHPLAKQARLSLIPIDLLLDWANPQPAPTARLVDTDQQTTLVDVQALYDDIEANGMRDPFTLILSKGNNTLRLESGNHRVQIFADQGISHLPVALFVFDGLFNEANGHHRIPMPEGINTAHLLETRLPYALDPLEPVLIFEELMPSLIKTEGFPDQVLFRHP